MEKTQANIRINELTGILNDANRRYYVENSPTLSDFEFDMLLKELEALEKEFPELVISDADGFKSVQYSNLTPILIEAMKEQQQIIDNQQKQLEAFKTDKANLQQQIDELRSLIEQLMNK